MNTPVSESKPVRVLYGVSAGVLVVAAGLPLLTPPDFDWIGPALGLIGAALVAGLGKFTEGKVTPNDNVAARVLPSGKVIAGPAADQRDGTSVIVKQDLSRGADGAAFGEPFDTPPRPAGH